MGLTSILSYSKCLTLLVVMQEDLAVSFEQYTVSSHITSILLPVMSLIISNYSKTVKKNCCHYFY